MSISSSQFVAFHYNISSTNPAITDKQCQDLYNESERYSIDNDKVIYQANSHYDKSDYQRTNIALLNDDSYLFTGFSTVAFSVNGKKFSTKENDAFTLTISEEKNSGDL